MKIRWTGESVRFRITPTEMELLRDGKIVAETLSLPGQEGLWQALLMATDGVTSISLDGPDLIVSISDADRERLFQQEAIGIYFTTSGRPTFRYSIEKDLPCENPRTGEAAEPAVETFCVPPGFVRRTE